MEVKIVFSIEGLVAVAAGVGEAAREVNALNVLSGPEQKILYLLSSTLRLSSDDARTSVADPDY